MLSNPRPAKYRKLPGFEDNVRNMIINYLANTRSDLTIRYLYDKTDIQTAVQNHDFLPLPMTEYWIDRPLELTREAATQLEVATREQANSKLWHSSRKWQITASKFGDISKATECRNMEKLCKSIVSPVELTGDPVLHGKQFESVAIKKFQRTYKIPV